MPFGFLHHLGPTELLVILCTSLFFVWPMCRICSKAGFPWPLGLLAILPFLNLLLLLFLALADWPALRPGKPQPDRDF